MHVALIRLAQILLLNSKVSTLSVLFSFQSVSTVCKQTVLGVCKRRNSEAFAVINQACSMYMPAMTRTVHQSGLVTRSWQEPGSLDSREADCGESQRLRAVSVCMWYCKCIQTLTQVSHIDHKQHTLIISSTLASQHCDGVQSSRVGHIRS